MTIYRGSTVPRVGSTARGNASDIDVEDAGGLITATNVEDALQENRSVFEAHLVDTVDAHDASAISNVPAGNIAAITVQAAIDELDSEKQPLDATLTSLSSLGTAANKYPYTTGVDTWVEGDIDLAGRNILNGRGALVFDSKSSAVTYITANGIVNNAQYDITSADGGTFIGVTGSSGYADDGGSYCGTRFIPTGGDGSTALVRKYPGSINVVWYGYGSATTHTAINSAITRATTENRSVFIPYTGGQTLTGGIVLKAGVTVYCHDTLTAQVASAITTLMDFTGVDDAAWIGGSIVGDNTTTTQNGFVITNADRNIVKDVVISNTLNKGIDIGGTSTWNQLAPKRITGCAGTAGAGISIFGSSTYANVIYGGEYSGNRIGITINGSDYNKVITPTCSNNTEAGLMIDGVVTASGDGGRYNEIIGGSYTGTTGSSYGGIYLGNGSSYNKITSPVCNSNAGAGIRMTGGSGYENYGNSIISPHCESNSVSGIVLSFSPHTTVKDPQSIGNTSVGISIFTSDYCQVSGGRVQGNTAQGILIQSGYCTIRDTLSTLNDTGLQVAAGGSTATLNHIIDTRVSGNTTSDYVFANATARVDAADYNRTLADAGDANATVYGGTGYKTVNYATAITADRSVVFTPSTAAKNGDRFRVVRQATATGAFNVLVASLSAATLSAANTWVEIEYNSGGNIVVAKGTL